MQTLIMEGAAAIEKGAALIRRGDVVVFPTETVYGLGADAFNETAVEEIFRAKGRPNDNPLIVHIADKSELTGLTREISPQAQKVIEAFMPGPITVILPKSDRVPDCVTAGLDTVGIRMPAHPVARAFINACNTPVAAPSANTSTRISPTSARHVYDDMQGKIPLIIDGGACDVGIESTIVDLSSDTPTILRPGAITAQMLAQVLGKVQTFHGQVVVAKAPGMKYKHYAPDCEMAVCSDLNRAKAYYEECVAQGGNPVILCSSRWAREMTHERTIDLGEDGTQVMKNIYGAMHTGEEIADTIICQDFGQEGKYASVMNRVEKASGGKRI